MKLQQKLRMQSDHKPNCYLLDKPKSWTSQDLCTKLKKNFNFQLKISGKKLVKQMYKSL